MNRKYCLFFALLLVVAAMALSSCNKTNEKPQLTLSADTLVFKGPETLTLSITTNNTDRREVYLNCPDYWISIYPQSGRIMEGETLVVQITSYLDDPMSVKESVLHIVSAFDEKTVKLMVCLKTMPRMPFPRGCSSLRTSTTSICASTTTETPRLITLSPLPPAS